MRLLKLTNQGELCLTEDLHDNIPPYAILSHTWGEDKDEVDFDDIKHGSYKNKRGYAKIRFCGEQAKRDNLKYFWVDTCCIHRANLTELSEAITSMFRWYHDAVKCYVYLSDVSIRNRNHDHKRRTWKLAFRRSRWFTRCWTLQELIAPKSVEFFSQEEEGLGSKSTLELQIHGITSIPVSVLRGAPLPQFSFEERMKWVENRNCQKKEDKAYSLLGIFDVSMSLRYGEGENAFIRLKEKLNKSQRGLSSEHGNIHWAVSRSPNPLFTGRDVILDSLEASIRAAIQHNPPTAQSCIVISGIGGQGKSEICVQLAQRVRLLLWGVFWVDVSTLSSAENGFLGIANRLKVPAKTWEDGRQGLAGIQQPWMLVLDNADDPKVNYQDFFPTGPFGIVMLTSRIPECEKYATTAPIALKGLSLAEGRKLLFRAAHVADNEQHVLENDADHVTRLLQSHPLALIQAGAYTGCGHCTLAQYPNVYQRQRRRLLKFHPSQAHSRYRDIFATFEASIEILQTMNTEAACNALQLLPVLAICGHSPLPLGLFEAGWTVRKRMPPDLIQAADDHLVQLTQWHISHLPSLLRDEADEWDSFPLVQAVNVLSSLALISADMHDGQMSVSMHSLVHAWARDRQIDQEQHESWLKMGCLVAISGSDRDFWISNGRQLQPHLQAMMLWDMGCIFGSEAQEPIMWVLLCCGWLMSDLRDYRNLFVLLDNLFIHLELDKMVVSDQWVELYDLTGRSLQSYGKVNEAVRLLEQIVESRKRTLAADHLDQLRSRHALILAYLANGQLEETLEVLEHIVQIAEKIPADHLPVDIANDIVALVYRESGLVNNAVRLLEEVVKTKAQVLPENHPDLLDTQQKLGLTYLDNGQVKKAVWLLELIVKIKQQTLAKEDPGRLESEYNLALAYKRNGQVQDAATTLTQVVVTQEQALAPDHPDRLGPLRALASLCWDLDRELALRLIQNVVRIGRKVLDKDHRDQKESEALLAQFQEEGSNG